MVDAGLALLTAVGIVVAIRLAREPGARPPDALAYALGLAVASLVLLRRRWPLGVLLASTVTLQTYYVLDYPGISPAVPLAVALATATAAGHLRWSLLVSGWYVFSPLVFRTLVRPEPVLVVLGDAVPIAVLLGAVVLLGEAVRSRGALDREHRLLLAEREKSERLLLNVLPASIAARLKEGAGTIADEFPRCHGAVRGHRGLHATQRADGPQGGGGDAERPLLRVR